MPIFDQGYQHWNGELTSHAWRWYSIARHGVRIGMKNRLLRIVLLLAWLPAVGLAATLSLWGLVEQKSTLIAPLLPFLQGILGHDVLADPKSYRVEIWTICYDYFLLTELRFSMVLVLIVGPSLISQDLRFNALPLYFSRPLRSIDYFLGKLGVIAWFLGMVLIIPSLIAYVLGLLFSLDFTIIGDTVRLLLASVGYGAVMTMSAGLFILALSSLSRNSRYIALFWIGVWFVSSLAGTVVETIYHEHQRREQFQRHYARRSAPPPNQGPRNREQEMQQARAQREADRAFWEQIQADELESAQRDWRPMLSYTANLSRVGRRLLGTDSAWRRFADEQPPDMRTRFLLQNLGPQYPWHWSAALLAVLFGISACILNFRVKSLDRLK